MGFVDYHQHQMLTIVNIPCMLIIVNNPPRVPVLHTPRDVGALVRDARLHANLTQAQLAARIGASRFWVVAFEAGKARAELGLVLKALRALGLTVVAEREGAGPAPPPARHSELAHSTDALDRLRALFGDDAPKKTGRKKAKPRKPRGG
jgi:DNA-binding XRE family transcriptional regulator